MRGCEQIERLTANQPVGTDGVRGRAGQYPLDPATVARLLCIGLILSGIVGLKLVT